MRVGLLLLSPLLAALLSLAAPGTSQAADQSAREFDHHDQRPLHSGAAEPWLGDVNQPYERSVLAAAALDLAAADFAALDLAAAAPTEEPEPSQVPDTLQLPGPMSATEPPEPTAGPTSSTSPGAPTPPTGSDSGAEAETLKTTSDPTAPPSPTDRGESGLPITGAQVGGMVLLGTGMVAGGVAMLTVRRRRHPADLLG